jgi:predicted ATP-grasp superfamily ATP-dependent carboligase
MSAPDILIIGASTRAAAMSARRAGMTPWCADLFADADLERIATVRKIAADDYPEGLLGALADAPPAPVMYTGALENRPDLIACITQPLIGNSAEVLRAVRSAERWYQCLRDNDLPCLAIAVKPTTSERWLLKPRKGASGFGIQPYVGQAFNSRTHFLQERLDGIPCSGIFLGLEQDAAFLGITQQLIGTPWLNASEFHYAGNIGPLPVPASTTFRMIELGSTLAREFHLRGLFGIDLILRDGVPWPVEINPRYTASVEILERSFRLPMLRWHRQAFEDEALSEPAPSPAGMIWGKGILYARATIDFPAEGPWSAALAAGIDVDSVEYADIPHAGEVIEQGRPVLTIFASGKTVSECETNLQEKAQALDRRLWG